MTRDRPLGSPQPVTQGRSTGPAFSMVGLAETPAACAPPPGAIVAGIDVWFGGTLRRRLSLMGALPGSSPGRVPLLSGPFP